VFFFPSPHPKHRSRPVAGGVVSQPVDHYSETASSSVTLDYVMSYYAIGDAHTIVERIAEYVDAGLSKFILRPANITVVVLIDVSLPRDRLMGPPPDRPCDDVSGLDSFLGETIGDAADFLKRPSD
jgi:hypothetical protein